MRIPAFLRLDLTTAYISASLYRNYLSGDEVRGEESDTERDGDPHDRKGGGLDVCSIKSWLNSLIFGNIRNHAYAPLPWIHHPS